MAETGVSVSAGKSLCPEAGPNGGDGGKGGDIVLRGDVHTDNLVDFYYQPLLKSTRRRTRHGQEHVR